MKRRIPGINFVIGVDGGGTKTVAVVADERGKIVARKDGGPTNYHAAGEKCARDNLKRLLAPLLRRYRVRNIVFGFAGLDSQKDHAVYQRIVKAVLRQNVSFSLYNDAEIALEAMPRLDFRVLVIAGTGSAIWGQRGDKKVKAGRRHAEAGYGLAKAGGLDFLLSDEGSAYYLGLEALRAAVRSFDGRGQKTILEGLVLKRAKAKDIPDTATKIYLALQNRPEDFKTYIASFAPLVGTAFAKNDKVAKTILEESANELFLGAKAVVKRLKLANAELCVGYVGSAFRAPLMKNLLSAKIKKLAPKARFIDVINPVAGAVKMALRE